MKHAVLALAATLTLSQADASSILFTDDFEEDILRQNADSLIKWTVTNGRIDVVGPGLFDDYPGNGHYIDMDGSSANAAKITTRTVFDLIPGQSYTLTFDYGKSSYSPGPERMSFGIGDWSDEIRIPAAPIPALISMSYDFTVTTTLGQLFFNAFGGDNAGPILDNVNLSTTTPVGAEVPLPPAGTSLLAGLVGLWTVRRLLVRPVRSRGSAGGRSAAP